MSKPDEVFVDAKKEEAAAEWVAVGALKPWAKNPRRNDANVKRVAASIRRFGFAAPILARREDGEVIAGHTRLAAAKQLGLDRVPVRYLDLAAGEAHVLALADNRLTELGEWDEGELEALLVRLSPEDAAVAGFEEAAPEGAESLDVEELDLAATHAPRFFVAIDGPLAAQPDALDRLRAHLEALPGVVVTATAR